MIQLIRDNNEVKYKKLPITSNQVHDKHGNHGNQCVKQLRYYPLNTGTIGIKKWCNKHNEFLEWLTEEFITYAYAVNKDCIVHINKTLLKEMMADRIYRSSYNKEVSFEKLL